MKLWLPAGVGNKEYYTKESKLLGTELKRISWELQTLLGEAGAKKVLKPAWRLWKEIQNSWILDFIWCWQVAMKSTNRKCVFHFSLLLIHTAVVGYNLVSVRNARIHPTSSISFCPLFSLWVCIIIVFNYMFTNFQCILIPFNA